MTGTDEHIDDIGHEEPVELTDDEGNTVAFDIVLIVELDGVDYAALAPVDGPLEGDDDEIYLFVYEEHEEEGGLVQSFSPIQDDATFERVQQFCAEQMDLLSGD